MKLISKRKLLAAMLSACMVFQTIGIVPVYAVENSGDSGLPLGTSSVYTEDSPCTSDPVDCEICNKQDNGTADNDVDTIKDLGAATQSNAEYTVKAPCQSETESCEYLDSVFEQEGLTQEDESLFEAHLEQCSFCAEYVAQMQPMAVQYIIQKSAIKCTATYAFTINGVDAGASCRVYEGDNVKVKITLTSVKTGYEYKRVELRSGYGATAGDNLGEISQFTPVSGEEMTWTFTVPPQPSSTYAVINVIAEEVKIDPIPQVSLTSTATTMEYDTNNVGFTAKVIDTANNNAAMTAGTVQFYLNNEAIGDPVAYSSSYGGYYKGIRSYQYLDNPYLEMGQNEIKAEYTDAESGTTKSNTVTVTLTKKDISSQVGVGDSINDSIYTGTYGVGQLYFSLSGSEEGSLVKSTDYIITGTKDGEIFTPEYEYRYWNIISIKLINAGTYTITATLKDDITYYKASKSYTVTIEKATPTVTVSSAVIQRSQGVFGGGVTLIANVDGVNNENPTGTIQFKEGVENIGSAVTVNEGVATYDWTGYGAGTHNITAEFTPATTGTGANYTASKNATAYSLDIDKAVPIVTWGTTAQSTIYTGSSILESALKEPTVTLMNGDNFSGTFQYAYKNVDKSAGESATEYTDGLPTNTGTYEIKASVVAQGNYTAAESTNTMTLTINKSTPSLTIDTMSGKTYDGTEAANPTVADMTIKGAVYADVTFTYSKNSDMSSPLATAPKDAGPYYVQASVDEGANTNAATSAAKSFTITRIDPAIKVETDETSALSGKDIIVTVKITNPTGITTGFPAASEIDITPTNATLKTAIERIGETGVYTATFTLADYSADAKATFKATVPTATTNYNANTTGTTSDAVNILDKYEPTVIISPSKTAVIYGETVILTATVGKNSNTSDLAGTVQFKNGTTPVGSPVEIDQNGMATLNIDKATLTVKGGTAHSFTAVFTPEAGSDYKAKTSSECTVTVSKSAMTGDATITGTAKFGSTLRADTSALKGISEDDLGTFTYQWKSAGENITDATSQTYIVKKADLSKAITVEVTPVNANYNAKTSIAVTPSKADSSIAFTMESLGKTYDGSIMQSPVKTTHYTTEGSTGSVTFEWYQGATALASAPKDVGSYTVKALLAEDDTYEAASATKTFEITAKAITPNIEAISDQTYTGSELKPLLTVMDSSTTLTPGTDYTAVYSKNINAGTGEVTVTLNGNYSGSATGTFIIAKAAALTAKTGQLTVTNNRVKDYEFDLTALLTEGKNFGTITYAVKSGTATDYYDALTDSNISGSKWTLSVKSVDSTTEGIVGTVIVTITSQNYEDMDATITVNAINKAVPVVTVSGSYDYTYGQALSTKLLTGVAEYEAAAVEGTLTWTTPEAKPTVGTTLAAWTFTPDNDGEYAEVTGTQAITVAKAKPTGMPGYTKVTASGKTLADTALTLGTITPAGTVAWDLTDTTEVVRGMEYLWIFVPDDSTNYENLTGKLIPWEKSTNGGGSSSGSNSGAVGNTTGTTTTDQKKGLVNSVTGIVTGCINTTAGDGYSHWQSNEMGWKLQYADGTYATGAIVTGAAGNTREIITWELINGAWYAFGSDSYAKSGLCFDPVLNGWFYIDINFGMKTGWQLIDSQWRYFNPISDGTKGKMVSNTKTLDGYYVDGNGVWDGKEKTES